MLEIEKLLSISDDIDKQVRKELEKTEEKKTIKKDSVVLTPYVEEGVSHRTIKVRFLPSPHQSEKFMVNGKPRIFHHVYDMMHKLKSGNAYKYIRCSKTSNKALETNTHKCPVCNYLFSNNMYDDDYETYKDMKAKQNLKANVYVYLDTMNPDNNGKVMIINLNNSKTLLQALEKMWHGEKIPDTDQYVDGNEPRQIFKLLEGPDVTISVTKKGQFPDYNVSLSRNDSAFLGGDVKEIETVIKQCHNLEMFVDPEVALLSYEKAEEEFNKFMSGDLESLSSKDEAESNDTKKFNEKLKEKLEEDKEVNDEPLPTFDKPDKTEKKVEVKEETEFCPDDFFS